MAEKELRRVVFEFKDGKKRVLEGEELDTWQMICMSQSDYLLPGDENMQILSLYGGLARGFMPKRMEGKCRR